MGRAAYLVGYLDELGYNLNVGMGPFPLTQEEIRCWQDNTRVELYPWEVLALRTLSEAYVAQLALSRDRGAPAPYQAEVIGENQRKAVDSFFRRMAAQSREAQARKRGKKAAP